MYPLDRSGPRGQDEPSEDALQAGPAPLVNKYVWAPADADLEDELIYFYFPDRSF